MSLKCPMLRKGLRGLSGRREIKAPPAPPDLEASPAVKVALDPKDPRVCKGCKGRLDPLENRAYRAHLVGKDPRGLLVRMVLRDPKGTSERLAFRGSRALQGILVKSDLKDLWARRDPPDSPVALDLLVCRVREGRWAQWARLDVQDPLVSMGRTATWGRWD